MIAAHHPLPLLPRLLMCRARIQIKKEEEELNRAFGSGPIIKPRPQQHTGPRAPKGTAQLPAPIPLVQPVAAKPAAVEGAAAAGHNEDGGSDDSDADGAADGGGADSAAGGSRPVTVVQIFGDSKAVEKAVAMIEEALANRQQKAKQRAAQYDKKREQKRRERQMYHLRHARDYEELGLPMGASKIDIKKAYK